MSQLIKVVNWTSNTVYFHSVLVEAGVATSRQISSALQRHSPHSEKSLWPVCSFHGEQSCLSLPAKHLHLRYITTTTRLDLLGLFLSSSTKSHNTADILFILKHMHSRPHVNRRNWGDQGELVLFCSWSQLPALIWNLNTWLTNYTYTGNLSLLHYN